MLPRDSLNNIVSLLSLEGALAVLLANNSYLVKQMITVSDMTVRAAFSAQNWKTLPADKSFMFLHLKHMIVFNSLSKPN